MERNSSTVILTAAASNAVVSMRSIWLPLWFELFEPDIVIFGLCANALVFIVMPRQGVAVGKSTKIYYTSIAISDFFYLIVYSVLYTLSTDSMYALLV